MTSHRTFESATSFEDLWNIIGNSIADRAAAKALQSFPTECKDLIASLRSYRTCETHRLKIVLQYLVDLNLTRLELLKNVDSKEVEPCQPSDSLRTATGDLALQAMISYTIPRTYIFGGGLTWYVNRKRILDGLTLSSAVLDVVRNASMATRTWVERSSCMLGGFILGINHQFLTVFRRCFSDCSIGCRMSRGLCRLFFLSKHECCRCLNDPQVTRRWLSAKLYRLCRLLPSRKFFQFCNVKDVFLHGGLDMLAMRWGCRYDQLCHLHPEPWDVFKIIWTLYMAKDSIRLYRIHRKTLPFWFLNRHSLNLTFEIVFVHIGVWWESKLFSLAYKAQHRRFYFHLCWDFLSEFFFGHSTISYHLESKSCKWRRLSTGTFFRRYIQRRELYRSFSATFFVVCCLVVFHLFCHDPANVLGTWTVWIATQGPHQNPSYLLY